MKKYKCKGCGRCIPPSDLRDHMIQYHGLDQSIDEERITGCFYPPGSFTTT